MARVVLHDDPIDPAYADRGPQGFGTPVALPGDPVPVQQESPFPVLTVRVRTRTGFDADGDPEFSWSTLIEEVATVWSTRQETDDVSGLTLLRAKAVVLYSGDVRVSETAVVESSHDGLFRVLSVQQTPDRLEMELEQVVASG